MERCRRDHVFASLISPSSGETLRAGLLCDFGYMMYILLSYLVRGRLSTRCVVRLSGGGSEERLSPQQSFSLAQHTSLDVLATTSTERGTQAGTRKAWLGGDCRRPGWQCLLRTLLCML